MPNLIFGKVFASMFEGSMYGAGAHVFAVMTYVIANMQPNKERVEYVRLNPVALAHTIGEPLERIESAIAYLCGKDLATTSIGEEGKRLVMESPFLYRVVNGQYYRELKNEEDRLEKAAVRQAKHRARKNKSKKGSARDYVAGERRYIKALETNGQAAADAQFDRDQENGLV
jgi:hypothetical protein